MTRWMATAAACAALALLIAAWPPASRAATPEESYLATRDAAIARLKAAVAAEQRGPMDGYGDAIVAEEKRAREALEQQMRAIVGPVALKGIAGEGTLNLDTLIEGDQGFGLLDGLVYGGPDDKTRVIVTTDGLLARWLRAHKEWWGKDSTDIPQDMSAAVKAAAFYSQAVLTDSAVLRYAELPLRQPATATLAFAMLAARTQDTPPPQADELFVALAQGGRVFIAYTSEFAAVGPIAACDAIRAGYEKQASEASEDRTLDDNTRTEKSGALMTRSETEFLRCFAEQAPKQKGFAAAVQAAQALLDRLPAR